MILVVPPFSLQRFSQIQPRHAWHLDVRDEDVGPILQRCGQRSPAIAHLADHLHVGLEFQQRCKRTQHHSLILGDNDAYPIRHGV